MAVSDLWGSDAAERYDDPASPMFDPGLLDRTTRFLAELAADGPALELAIGTGRVAVPLAARGVRVSGIELSEPMIRRLRSKSTAADIPVVVGDMATATAPGEFALVYLVFNTISNLLTQDAQAACFANAARHLRPGGHFVVECWIPELRRLPPGQSAVPFDVSEGHLGFDVFDDLVAQRLTSHHFSREPDGDYRRSASHHRYVWPSELDLMARLAGMRLVRRVADWDGAPLTGEHRSAISVWQKPPRH